MVPKAALLLPSPPYANWPLLSHPPVLSRAKQLSDNLVENLRPLILADLRQDPPNEVSLLVVTSVSCFYQVL